MRYLITITSIFILSIVTNYATAQSADPVRLFADKPVKVSSVRQSLENNLNKILMSDTEFHKEVQADIDARMEIDQRYFQNRFKILSNETPILYKLYT